MRAKMPTIEELDEMLKHPAIENLENQSCGDELFQRGRAFTVRGMRYKVVWYRNAMTVFIGNAEEVMVWTNGLSLDGYWPNQFKLNLNFTTDDCTSLVIPLEPYENVPL